MIRTINISKVFRAKDVETRALQDVTLEVQSGEFIAIMGPSGCGKTTLLNILGMIDDVSDGRYFFNDTEISSLKEKQRAKIRRKNIGFIFQNFNLIDELTVFENVELPLIYQKIGSRDRKFLVEKALDQTKILHRKSIFPVHLSGGQQQRVAIARAIVSSPRLILADEPTGNLDSANGTEVMNLLENLNKNGTTIVMVTHSHRDADYSRRMIRLFDGKIIHENYVNRMTL
ncbi:MAG: phosphonate ABC transporter ATP-binding protein [Bacteroidetes bacterium GWF2_38_335]|nr:MAG: phosphonate ABC transporter ATP-binding protein [Bacteroidetes bacterium GWF2_38_335]OFY81986.1 MAG: phosphonate ABC transporter ATP-binding protein [Bacteroidetes bacterium RIFOXYA12_FULL_38_20]